MVLYRWVNPPFTPLMMIRFVDQLVDGREIVLQQQWISIQDISPNVVYAVVAGEDQRFVSHIGFDFQSMYNALEYNLQHKTIGIGGSTISQQTAKNVFLWPGRSFLRKGLEAYCTLFMEIFWSKERILEVYLNVIEFGDGIYGIESASQKYFHISAHKLSVSQAAFLSAMLPNPRYFEDHLRDYWLLRRKSTILRNIGTVKRNSQTRGFVRALK